MTKLDKVIKREIDINGEPHVLTITPDGLVITKKRARSGVEAHWGKVQEMLEAVQ